MAKPREKKIHPTMARLYEAAVERYPELAKDTQAAVARALNTSSAAVNNWDSRGISQRGANLTQAELGISATWILSGEGEKFVGASVIAAPRQASQVQRQEVTEPSVETAHPASHATRLDPRMLRIGFRTVFNFLEARGAAFTEQHLDLLELGYEWAHTHDNALLLVIDAAVAQRTGNQEGTGSAEGEAVDHKAGGGEAGVRRLQRRAR